MTNVPAPTSPAPHNPAGSPAAARPRRPHTAWKGWVSLGVVAVITYWAGSARWGIDVNLGDLIRNFSNGADKLAQIAQPSFKHFDQTIMPMLQSISVAIAASAVACAVALPITFLATRVTMPNRFVRGPVRAVMSVVRSVPDILYASILVTIVGIGPLPGVIALTLASVGFMVKLFAEVIDAVDTGPAEAAVSSGATRTEVNRTAILPQVLPHYTAFSLFIFEINIRTGTVIGLVGAGGIGKLINDWQNYYRYHDIGLIILEVLVVVLVIEAASAALRRRLS